MAIIMSLEEDDIHITQSFTIANNDFNTQQVSINHLLFFYIEVEFFTPSFFISCYSWVVLQQQKLINNERK